MKIRNIFILLMLSYSISSCYKDIGNYEYEEKNEITITNIPEQINVLGNIDTLKIAPIITSSKEGVITADNPNYSYVYAESGQMDLGQMKYVALDSTYPKDLNYFVKLEPKIYSLNFVVTDKRTGVQTITPFKLNVTSSVTEGWMVLCNEGENDRVRMDMISVISQDRHLIAYDIASTLGLPDLNKATKLTYVYRNPQLGKINIITENQGAYDLNHATLRSGPSYSMKNEFGNKNDNGLVQNLQRTGSYYLIVDGDNNAFSQMFSVAGPIFQFPVNNTTSNRATEFKISKHFVSDKKTVSASTTILAYDISNKRFISWASARPNAMITITYPTTPFFDVNTGKDIVYMEACLYGNGTAYTILEKDNIRYLYGHQFTNIAGRFNQTVYAELNIPEINNAKYFAFHSTLPYMFYAVGPKLYQYDIVNKTAKLMKTFVDEEITALKFNLLAFTGTTIPQYLKDQQYDLIVGTKSNKYPEGSNGILRMFEVPSFNQDLIQKREYKGFARIVDVTYKEIPIR